MPAPPSPALPATAAAAVSTADFRNGLALLAGAVNIITTDGPAGRAGFTASAVCSVSDTPPTVLVCMNRSSYAHGFFAGNGVLCINVLAASQQPLSALFASRDATMDQRFAAARWQRLATGAPALDGALVQLDGDIIATHTVGTHSVFIVGLRGIATPAPAAEAGALTYFDRRYHALGLAAR